MTLLSQDGPKRYRGSSRRNKEHVSDTSADLYKLGRRAFPLLFALAYATILTNFPIDAFKDRHNYLIYADASEVMLAGNIIRGWSVALANEPLWLIINVSLRQFLDVEQVVRVLIFIPAFVVPYLTLRNNPKYFLWLMLFLLIPQVMKNHVIHLRQGVGVAIFMAGYYANPKSLRLGLMGAAGLVHSSFLVVGLIGIIVWIFLKLKVAVRLRVLIMAIQFGILGFFLNLIAASAGARQGEQYVNFEVAISGLGFAFWAFVFFIFTSSRRKYILENIFPISILAFYLPVYFVTPVAARILESALLLVLISGLSLEGWRRQLFLACMTFYTFAIFLLRLDQPWLGWGVPT